MMNHRISQFQRRMILCHNQIIDYIELNSLDGLNYTLYDINQSLHIMLYIHNKKFQHLESESKYLISLIEKNYPLKKIEEESFILDEVSLSLDNLDDIFENILNSKESKLEKEYLSRDENDA